MGVETQENGRCRMLKENPAGSARMHDMTAMKDGRIALIGYDVAILPTK